MAKHYTQGYKQSDNKVDQSIFSVSRELPVQVESLYPNLQLWVANGHNLGLINEFKSTKTFCVMKQEIVSLHNWFMKPIDKKQPTITDIIDRTFKLANISPISNMTYSVFLCCNILNPKFNIDLETETNGEQAYVNLALGDCLEISALIWSALGCPSVAKYVNNDLRQIYIDHFSKIIERKMAFIKLNPESELSIGDNHEISTAIAEISRLNHIEPLPIVGSQLDPLERQKVLDACAQIDAEYINGLVNTLNKCHPDAVYSIGTHCLELVFEALKQCDNNEAASRLRQKLFTEHGMPKIKDALRIIKAQEIYLGHQTLDAADFFATEQGRVIIKHKTKTIIDKQLCIIEDVLILFSPKGNFLRSTDPQIIREIKDWISQEKCDCAQLNKMLAFFTQDDNTISASASGPTPESSVYDTQELPQQKFEALFDVHELT